jgi:hypothetical protein
MYGIAADRYGEVLIRESAVVLGITVLAATLAALVAHHRRPE